MSAIESGAGSTGAAASMRWGNKVVMVCGGLLVTLALTALASVMPQIEAELSHGPADSIWVKQIVGIIGVSIVVGAPLTGWLIDRFSVKRILISCCLLVAVAGSAGLFMSNLPLLVATRFVTDAAAVGVATCSMTLINTRLVAHERPRWMGLHVAVYMASGTGYYPIAGWLGERGWRMPFLMYLIALPLALIVLIGFKDTPVVSSETVGTGANAAPAPNLRLADWFPFRFMLIGYLVGCTLYMPVVYTPFALRAIGLTSPQKISLLLSAASVIPAVSAYLYGRVGRRLSVPGIFAFGFGSAGLGACIVAMAGNVPVAFTGLAFLSVGMGMLVPNLMTALGLSVTAAQQGRAVGIVKASQYIANTAVPFMIEPFARVYGPKSAFFAVAAIGLSMLLITGCQLLFVRPRPAASAQTPV